MVSIRADRSLDSVIITSYAHSTEYLDLSHNRIHNLSWLYEFPHLKCLIMDDNRLREPHFEKLIQPLTNLHTLMLNKNEVSRSCCWTKKKTLAQTKIIIICFTAPIKLLQLSDLKTTAGILQRIFPNVEYLSLHGNAMCPDNLLLQPFCEFVPYEYNHYR